MSTNSIITLPISDIEINGRYRKDFGNIQLFADDINKIGLIVPITVTYNPITKKYTLVDGQRRILSYQILGRTEIPCYVINLEKIILGEYSANTYRKDWTDSELYTITEDLKPIFTEEAKKRQSEAGKLFGRGKKTVNGNDDSKSIAMGNFPQANTKGRALDNLSNAFGVDRKTLNKIQKIGDAAKQNPEKYKPLFQKVDAKKISREEAVNIIKRDKQREKKKSENPPIAELPPSDRLLLFNEDSTKIDRKKLPSRIHSIITDPPYSKQDLPLYEWLAEFANNELQEGDSLIFLCGHIILDDVFAIFRKYPDLKFYWILDLDHKGPSATIWPRKFFADWKPILYFVKGNEPAHQIKRVSDKIESKKPDKSDHEMAQSIIEFEFMVENFTVENQTVFDPFLGEEANTAKACIKLNRRCAGIEKDKELYEKALKKIQEFQYETNNNNNNNNNNEDDKNDQNETILG